MIYLLHFDKPYKHAAHYLGFHDGDMLSLHRRLNRHWCGQGARLLQVVRAAGIGWQLAHVWLNGTRREERWRKMSGKARYCPICKRQARSVTDELIEDQVYPTVGGECEIDLFFEEKGDSHVSN